MFISKQTIADIQEKLTPSEIIKNYVDLKKRGKEYVGLSPFKQENTPSFTVNDQKRFFHCFSTNKHGTIFDFIMEIENVSFVEAAKILAQKAGITVQEESPETIAKQKRLSHLKKIILAANLYFHQSLLSSKPALKYIVERNVEKQTIIDFNLGYAPNNHKGLINCLTDQNFTMDDINSCGLVSQTKNNDYVDKFKDRIMFPICDSNDKPIAFGGRTINPHSTLAKYINSPQTELFSKKNLLFNFAKAKKSLHNSKLKQQELKPLIIVEGYMDVIALHQYGFPCCVAPMGTAVTFEQLKLAWQISPCPYVLMDNDQAGEKAAQAIRNIALPELNVDKTLNFVSLSQNADPDSYLQKYGRDAFLNKLNNFTPIGEAIFKDCNQNLENRPEDEAKLIFCLSEKIKKITNKTLQASFKRYFKNYMNEFLTEKSELSQKKEINNNHEPKYPQYHSPLTNINNLETQFQSNQTKLQNHHTEEHVFSINHSTHNTTIITEHSAPIINKNQGLEILKLLILHPELIKEFFGELNLLNLKDKTMQRILNLILDISAQKSTQKKQPANPNNNETLMNQINNNHPELYQTFLAIINEYPKLSNHFQSINNSRAYISNSIELAKLKNIKAELNIPLMQNNNPQQQPLTNQEINQKIQQINYINQKIKKIQQNILKN